MECQYVEPMSQRVVDAWLLLSQMLQTFPRPTRMSVRFRNCAVFRTETELAAVYTCLKAPILHRRKLGRICTWLKISLSTQISTAEAEEEEKEEVKHKKSNTLRKYPRNSSLKMSVPFQNFL